MSLALKVSRAGTQGGMYGTVDGGGILSALGGAVKKIGGAAIAVATGGGIAGAARAILPNRAPAPARPVVLPGLGNVAPAGVPRPGIVAAAQRAIPFGATGLGEGCPQGYHPNKSGYMTRSGWVEKGTRCVRNRRRNPLNPRALDRSISRIESAGKAVKALGFKAPKTKEIAQKGARKRRR